MIPVGGPNPTAQTMNYTVVINSAVWGGSLLYYFIDAHKWFTRPKITLDVSELTTEQEEALREEGFDIKIEGHAPEGHSEEVIGEKKGDKLA